MKKQAALGKRLHALRRELSVRFAASTVLQLAAQCGAAFAGGFLLAGVRLLGRNVPAALALTASLADYFLDMRRSRRSAVKESA